MNFCLVYTKPDSTFFKVRSSSIHRFVELIVWYKNKEIVGGVYLTGIPEFSKASINKNYFLKLRESILKLNPLRGKARSGERTQKEVFEILYA